MHEAAGILVRGFKAVNYLQDVQHPIHGLIFTYPDPESRSRP